MPFSTYMLMHLRIIWLKKKIKEKIKILQYIYWNKWCFCSLLFFAFFCRFHLYSCVCVWLCIIALNEFWNLANRRACSLAIQSQISWSRFWTAHVENFHFILTIEAKITYDSNNNNNNKTYIIFMPKTK